uniref:Protein kinase domain-containing protein n=1 Tax=Setaria viridis TaxID=4556 RepID=A0A4U6TDJ2_SETVI|nr:hypothetical protein SEVIR_8G052000v2 [Setaria viridis]
MDNNMLPKIADFGMSRLFGQQQSRIITQKCVGTLGYMAPEYINNGLISYKSDIFSLGVIIIELLIGSRDYPQSSETSFEHVIENMRQSSASIFARWFRNGGTDSKRHPSSHLWKYTVNKYTHAP